MLKQTTNYLRTIFTTVLVWSQVRQGRSQNRAFLLLRKKNPSNIIIITEIFSLFHSRFDQPGEKASWMAAAGTRQQSWRKIQLVKKTNWNLKQTIASWNLTSLDVIHCHHHDAYSLAKFVNVRQI